jgi:predicted nucleotidyltransferase
MVRPLRRASYLAQPLDAILGRPAAVRILRSLIRHGGQLSAPRLSREAELTLPGVAKALDHIEGLGLLRVAGDGRTRLYSVATEHPIAVMLDALFTAEAAYRDRVLATVADAARKVKPVGLWLFGSAARQQDREDSDLDLMLVVEGSDEERARQADAFRERLAEDAALVGLRPSVVVMSPEEIRSLAADNAPLWRAILAEARVILGRHPRAVAGQLRGAAA